MVILKSGKHARSKLRFTQGRRASSLAGTNTVHTALVVVWSPHVYDFMENGL
jgi:hypothetical protein